MLPSPNDRLENNRFKFVRGKFAAWPFSPRRFSYPETIKSINFKVFLLLDIQPGIRIPVYPPWVLLLSLSLPLPFSLSWNTSSEVDFLNSTANSFFPMKEKRKKKNGQKSRQRGRFIVGDCLHNLKIVYGTSDDIFFFLLHRPLLLSFSGNKII